MKQSNKLSKLLEYIPTIDQIVLGLLLLWSLFISLFQLFRTPLPNKNECYQRYREEFTKEELWPDSQLEIICQQEIQNYHTAYTLLLLSVLTFSMLIERWRKIDSLQNNIDQLQSMLNLADFKQQIKPIVGYEEWFAIAGNLIEQAEDLIYDASLSSRTWYRKDNDAYRDRFNKIREEKFKNELIETKYLTTFKTHYKSQELSERINRLKKNEYELKNYQRKLQADIDRITMIQNLTHQNYNFIAAYLPEVRLENPLVSFLVVDRKKVLLGSYKSEYKESDIRKDNAMLIENEEVANLFYQYFDLLWDNAQTFPDDSHDLKKILGELKMQQRMINEE